MCGRVPGVANYMHNMLVCSKLQSKHVAQAGKGSKFFPGPFASVITEKGRDVLAGPDCSTGQLVPLPARAGRSDVKVLSFVESKLACKCEALLSLLG